MQENSSSSGEAGTEREIPNPARGANYPGTVSSRILVSENQMDLFFYRHDPSSI
jgi:hypothetical protein